MYAHEVTPWPNKGQFWASLRPLVLLQVRYEVPNEETLISFRRWLPPTFEANEPEHDITVVAPLDPSHYRYLWYDICVPWTDIHLWSALESVPVPGMSFIETESERLFFLGPFDVRAEDGAVRILADWDVGAGLDRSLFIPCPAMTSSEPRGNNRYAILSGKDRV